jgi:hypothetical protein
MAKTARRPRTAVKLKDLDAMGLGKAGSCLGCLQGTDTCLATNGEAEWHIAFLMQFGIELEIATEMLSLATGCGPGKVPGEKSFTMYHRVCADCAREAGFPAMPALMTHGAVVPGYAQPESERS